MCDQASMEDDQASLAAQFSTFIQELDTYSTDWQIIVANQDNGCNQTGGVLRPTDSDYVTRFQSAVSAGGGWWTEAGLTITSQAVEMTDPGECNSGFLRSDAMLHIIMVSDESEQSTSSWNWYADKVVAKKGSSANVKFSAIAGDWPGGCATADPGEGYHQAVSATGGVFLSICSDWAIPSNMSMLAAASVQCCEGSVNSGGLGPPPAAAYGECCDGSEFWRRRPPACSCECPVF